MKNPVAKISCALVFCLGLGLMVYPTISNWLHAQSASQAITTYVSTTVEKDTYADDFAAARAYNATLSGDMDSFIHAQDGLANPTYWDTLNEVDGMMGILEIPTLDLTLPIYHGTDESVLQKGVGHLEGSALPTGDIGNHTVLTGHTGLPSADLFTDLDTLTLGDRFYVDVLDQTFTYEVVNLYVVLPGDTAHLVAQAGKDLLTLVTCTPYGVNTHRLLVQAQRVDTPVTAVPIAQAIPIEATPAFNWPMISAMVSGALALCALIGGVAYYYHYHIRFILPSLQHQTKTPQ